MKIFANNLKRLRQERNMSQNQLAKASHIPVKTLQNYEQDRNGNAPTLYNLLILADIFEISPTSLIYGGDAEEMKTNNFYMQELLHEFTQLTDEAIIEVHDSKASGNSVPKLTISDSVISQLAAKINENVVFPQRGFYKSYIEQTLLRYSQNRQEWKKKFNL